MTELILTQTERMRIDQDQRIAREFKDMTAAHPDASPARIMRSIAASGKYKSTSFYGIRAALVRSGAYVPTKRS